MVRESMGGALYPVYTLPYGMTSTSMIPTPTASKAWGEGSTSTSPKRRNPDEARAVRLDLGRE